MLIFVAISSWGTLHRGLRPPTGEGGTPCPAPGTNPARSSRPPVGRRRQHPARAASGSSWAPPRAPARPAPAGSAGTWRPAAAGPHPARTSFCLGPSARPLLSFPRRPAATGGVRVPSPPPGPSEAPLRSPGSCTWKMRPGTVGECFPSAGGRGTLAGETCPLAFPGTPPRGPRAESRVPGRGWRWRPGVSQPWDLKFRKRIQQAPTGRISRLPESDALPGK